jgi:hypothetical protein
MTLKENLSTNLNSFWCEAIAVSSKYLCKSSFVF